jgi:hypothetical protein
VGSGTAVAPAVSVSIEIWVAVVSGLSVAGSPPLGPQLISKNRKNKKQRGFLICN